MNRMSLLLLPLVVSAGLACAPIGETPGLRLGGSLAPTPDTFAFVQDTEIIQLSAKGMILPRVVNIWSVGFDDAMYVWSDPGSGWSERVAQRPEDVRVRIGDRVFAVRAIQVEDPAETARVGAAFQAKYAEQIMELYGQPMTPDDFELLFRLTPIE